MTNTTYTGGLPHIEVTPEKYEQRKRLIEKYIAHRHLIDAATTYEIMNIEFVSQLTAQPKVTVHIVLNPGATLEQQLRFEFTLQELQMFQGRQPLGGSTDIPPVSPRTKKPVFPGGAPATPTSAHPVIVDQKTWIEAHTEVIGSAKDLTREAKRHVVRKNDDGAFRLACGCPRFLHGDYLCDHLRFVYATAWDRGMLYDEAGSGNGSAYNYRMIWLPIGMGRVHAKFKAEIIEDPTRTGEKRTGEIVIQDVPSLPDGGILRRLAEMTSPFPSEVDHILLGPAEGSMKAIRYIDNLLRGTDEYLAMSKLIPAHGDASMMIDSICKRRHRGDSGRKQLSAFLSGMSHNSDNRDNWIIACVFTRIMTGMCLPCYEMTTDSAAIPNF